MKRIIALILTITSFIVFNSYVPLRIYEKAPILLSIIFSFIVVFLFSITLTNIFSVKKVKYLYQSADKFAGVFVSFIIAMLAFVVGLTFYFVINEMDKVENDLKINSKKTTGIILDKYQLKQTRRFQTYYFNKVKVEYLVNGEKIITEHNSNLNLVELPEKGDKVKILYSENFPENFIIDEIENSTKPTTLEDTMKLIESIK
ncbi:hypothetical protein [Flavobacterium psychrophilum]|uniref:hypothetical protein n=1 Tax=Flavobacterium psychrophilum TaxID=96345 RepID=UPI000B7C3D7B|nr:hypothetical protein [Flavobacterium psychrophilum]EKT3967435.1 hypothetical protein [Flavobacterium psychrophilum]ELV7526280.1 hypothetical protein [Flavobacterium psychrophilum]MCB6089607.1 hypothetical protein [Flavobacterium psychrophilum]MCB6232127.1 hypothetical protein [Flavobacterium psychrophilum]SNA73702.1 membrane hypothetical protein [Flavobacterium psychrophilum]